MEEIHKQVLIKCRVFLCDQLDVDYFMDYLIQEGIIDGQMKEKIKAPETRKERTEQLLDLLPIRGPTAFDGFLDSLKGKYDFVVYEILKKLDEVKKQQAQPADPDEVGERGPIQEVGDDRVSDSRMSNRMADKKDDTVCNVKKCILFLCAVVTIVSIVLIAICNNSTPNQQYHGELERVQNSMFIHIYHGRPALPQKPETGRRKSVRSPTKYFTGRTEQLEKIKNDYLEYRNNPSQLSKKANLVVISGLEGCGKTQLALQYSSLMQNNYSDVVWISANKKTKLDIELRRTAYGIGLKTLGLLSEAEENKEDQGDKPYLLDMIVPKLMEHFFTVGNVLIVFDGVVEKHILTDLFGETKTPFPRGSHVLITSRHKVWYPQLEVDSQIELGELVGPLWSPILFVKIRYGLVNETEAFFKLKSMPEKEQSALDTLLGPKFLAGHTLSISLVAANLRSTNRSAHEFLQQWQEGDPSWALTDPADSKYDINDRIKYPLLSSLETLDDAQLELIDLVCLLSQRFRENFLLKAAFQLRSPHLRQSLTGNAIDPTETYIQSNLDGLLKKMINLYIVEPAFENDEKVWIVHSVLVRINVGLIRQNMTRWVTGINNAITILNTLFPDYNTTFLHDHYTCRKESRCLEYDTLALYASSVARELTQMLTNTLFDNSILDDPIPALSSVVMYLRRHNRYQDAVPIMSAAVKLADVTYTGNSTGRCRYAVHLNQLGKLHFQLGNLLEAERLGTIALKLIRNFCQSKVQIARGYQILARALQYQDIRRMPSKKIVYIEYLLHETFNRKQDILKDVSPEMTEYRMDIEFRMYLACHNMGQFYQDLGRYDLALDYLSRAKEIWKKYQNGTVHWKITWLVSIASAEATRARNVLLEDKIRLNPFLHGVVWRLFERAVEAKGRHLADSNTSHQLGLYYLCKMAKKFPPRTHAMRVSALKYQEELKRVDTSGVFQKMLNTEFTQLHEEFPTDKLVWI